MLVFIRRYMIGYVHNTYPIVFGIELNIKYAPVVLNSLPTPSTHVNLLILPIAYCLLPLACSAVIRAWGYQFIYK